LEGRVLEDLLGHLLTLVPATLLLEVQQTLVVLVEVIYSFLAEFYVLVCLTCLPLKFVAILDYGFETIPIAGGSDTHLAEATAPGNLGSDELFHTTRCQRGLEDFIVIHGSLVEGVLLIQLVPFLCAHPSEAVDDDPVVVILTAGAGPD
jgi:hypothetical protein